MSVTKILFKQSSAAVTNSLNTTIGEPLWHIDSNSPYGQLYVTNGDSNRMPTLIGPYVHANGAIAVTENTHLTGDPNTAVTGGFLKVDADQGYALNGITIDSTGHVIALSAVALPTPSVPTLSITNTLSAEGNNLIATITYNNGAPVNIYAPAAGGTTGRNDELDAVEHNTTDPDGMVNLKTYQGNDLVTFKRTELQSGETHGTNVTFTIGSGAPSGSKYVEVGIEEIFGGTWS